MTVTNGGTHLSGPVLIVAAHPDTRVTLVYGNRRTDTVMFTEEIADLKNRFNRDFWIEDGQFVHPVSEVTISLNIDQMLKRIDMVGNDLDWKSSTVTPALCSTRPRTRPTWNTACGPVFE